MTGKDQFMDVRYISHPMNLPCCHLLFALLSLSSLGASVTAAAAPAAAGRPNIVFILADDLDYVHTNRFAERATEIPAARQSYEAPNLDRLGREGTAFAQAYACQ